jgi:hypothetical protein
MWSMMEVREASRALGVSEDELVEKSVKAYLENELRRIKAEMNSILTRYDVRSFFELDEKITGGALKETDSFEDYTRLDYLDSQRKKIEKVLGGDS